MVLEPKPCRFFGAACILAATLFVATATLAQSSFRADQLPPSPHALDSAADSPSESPYSAASSNAYVPPTEAQKFHEFAWNAFGPVAFAGSAVAGAIDQGFDFPHAWGQGADAYGSRVASNLGISLVTATAQYSMAEVFHEDTAYYHCTCSGFFPRFWHAALSSVAGRRGSDGHASFSIALTASPFIGPMVAANSWIPSHDGPTLGLKMGEHNLMGQFAQNEALEFLYGGPHTLAARIQRLFKKSARNTPQP